MLIQKSIHTSLEIEPKEMTGILDNIILVKLNNKFIKKCYAGCYIIKITNVVHSKCTLRNDKPGYGIVNVVFQCDVIVYRQNEIIIGIRVEHIESGMVVCYSEHTTATIEDADNFKSLKKGQIIPVRVLDTTYPILQEAIVITASINIISYDDTIQARRICLPQKVSQMSQFSNMLLKIKNEISSASSLKKPDKQIYLKFRDLLYPYKKKISYPSRLLSSIENVKEGAIIIDDTISNDSLDVRWFAKLTETKEEELDITEASLSFINMILENKFLHLILLRNLTNLYEGKLYTEHKNIWTFYEKQFKKILK